MPYKDPQRKQEWERRHRLQRLARRRQLRSVEAAQQSAPPDSASSPDLPWHLLAGGAALAIYSPALALGAGVLILVIAALRKKNWRWWATGTAIVAVALFLLSGDQRKDATDTIPAEK